MNLKGLATAVGTSLRRVATVLAVVVAVGGVLSFVPGYITFDTESRRSECRAILKGLMTEEQQFFARAHRYTEHTSDLEMRVDRPNRYAYFLGAGGTLEDRSAENAVTHATDVGIGADAFQWHTRPITAADLPPVFAGGHHLGVEGTCPDCTITLACAGQLGKGPLDVWSISSAAREQGGATVASGDLIHEVVGPGDPPKLRLAPTLILGFVLFWIIASIVLKVMALESRARGPLYQRLFAVVFYGFVALGLLVSFARMASGR